MGQKLKIIAAPSFTPEVGVAGSLTPITFDGVMNQDLIVLSESCTNPQSVKTGNYTLGKTQIVTTGNSSIMNTSYAMSSNRTYLLRVCFATSESGGDTPDDFIELAQVFTQIKPITFTPRRTVSGATQQFVVTGSGINDTIAWQSLNTESCNEATFENAAYAATVAYPLTTSAAQPALHRHAGAGSWNLCYRLNGGLWTWVRDYTLTVIPVPSFSPLVGIAGTLTPLTFSGTMLDDLVSITSTLLCNSTWNMTNSAHSLASTNLLDDRINTLVSMTQVGMLTVCFATKESRGNSADDFITLPIQFRQRSFPLIEPVTWQAGVGTMRTVSGAAQEFNFSGVLSGDATLFIHAANNMVEASQAQIYSADTQPPHAATLCQNTTANSATNLYTATYQLPSSSSMIALHTSTDSGIWVICFKAVGSMWTHLPDIYIEIVARPTFAPSSGISGSVTLVTFSGANDGDYIVMNPTGCSDPHLVTNTGFALARTQIATSSVSTLNEMHNATELYICLATLESEGDSPGDYAALDTNFTNRQPITFSPMRIVTGHKQQVLVQGARPDDAIFWIHVGSSLGSTNCSANASGLESGTQTNTSHLSATSQQLTLYSKLDPGTWGVCYKNAGGVWTMIFNLHMTVIELPTFSPLIGIAGSETPITFTGVQDGDYIVLTDTDCLTASSSVLGSTSSGVLQANTSTVKTSIQMTGGGQLRVCYATTESDGNTPDDYVALNAAFNAILPADFSPNRTSETSAQEIVVTGGLRSDMVAWVLGSTCQATAGNQSQTKTSTYLMIAPQTNLTLPVNLLPGSWQLCYKLGSEGRASNGLWTSVTNLVLTIVPLPSFSPHVGIAGSITPITIDGSMDGDVIVILPNDCSNAHLISDTNMTLSRTVIVNEQIQTTILMTSVIDLKLCFATAEASGDTNDDYAELPGSLSQLPAVGFWPTRSVAGAAQEFNLTAAIGLGDMVSWTQASDCTSTSGAATPSKSKEYTVTNASGPIILHTTAAAGTWIFCHKPNGGLWTIVHDAKLVLIAAPSFTPRMASGGSISPITFCDVKQGPDIYGVNALMQCLCSVVFVLLSSA